MMKKPAHIKLWTALLFLPLIAGGCSSRMCVAFCTNQAQLQFDYEASRDRCRELAELKMSTIPSYSFASEQGINQQNNDTKSQLVSLFSECMNNEGWLVPSPSNDKDKQTAGKNPSQPQPGDISSPIAPTPLASPAPQPSAEAQQYELKRKAECDFARQAASSSMISRKKAQTCELECQSARNRGETNHPACP